MKTYSKILKGIIYDNYVELGRGGGRVWPRLYDLCLSGLSWLTRRRHPPTPLAAVYGSRTSLLPPVSNREKKGEGPPCKIPKGNGETIPQQTVSHNFKRD